MCAEDGNKITVAVIVDHVRPHKGDADLFFDPRNLQSLCKSHHDATKQRQEARGYEIGADALGNPRDPSHHWNAP